MTPFGERVRSLRKARGITLKQMAGALELSPAYLSALEHGHRGQPSPALVVQICEYFHLIWDDYEEMQKLVRLSHPRVVVDTSGLAPAATELANLLATKIGTLDTAEIAAQMVVQCRYPPQGHRSVTGSLPQIDFASWPLGEAAAAINEATLVIVMIETPRAVDNVEEIAAVPGVDVLLVGTNDLCLEMGIPGQLDHPRVIEAFERITAACRAKGKHAGLGGVYTPPLIERYVGMGFRFILAGSDLSFMLAGARERAAAVRAMRPR